MYCVFCCDDSKYIIYDGGTIDGFYYSCHNCLQYLTREDDDVRELCEECELNPKEYDNICEECNQDHIDMQRALDFTDPF